MQYKYRFLSVSYPLWQGTVLLNSTALNGGGHWVTLVGIIDLGPLGAGIGFNDPDDGKNQTNWSWLDGDNGFSIRSYGKLNGGNVVDFAVAESVPEPGTLVLVTLGAIGLI